MKNISGYLFFLDSATFNCSRLFVVKNFRVISCKIMVGNEKKNLNKIKIGLEELSLSDLQAYVSIVKNKLRKITDFLLWILFKNINLKS